MNYNQMQGVPQFSGTPNQQLMGYGNFYNPYYQAYNPQMAAYNPQMQAMPQNATQVASQPVQAQQAVHEQGVICSPGTIAWVENLEEAESNVLTPGSTCVYFDKNIEGQYYIRTRDSTGQYQTRVFQSSELSDNKMSGVDMSNYVTKQELSDILDKIGGSSDGKQSLQSAAKSSQVVYNISK